jgi:rhamnosyltransferase subunit B
MSRLRILLVTIGSAGDVNPFLAIGRALSDRGHAVTLISGAPFENAALEAGLAFVPLGTRDDYMRVVDDPDLWDPNRGFRVFARRVVVPAIRTVYDLLISRMEPNTSTVIVAQGQAFGAHLVHEKHGIPFVTVNLQPAAFRTIHDTPLIPRWIPSIARPFLYAAIDFLLLDRELAGPMNAFRAELGLAPVKHILGSWAHSPDKTIGLFPEWFAAPQPDWPQNAKLAGFLLHSDGPGALPSELADFLGAGEPPIIFTPGTEMKYAHDFFTTSVQALAQLGRRGILVSRHTEHLPPKLPEGVISYPYIPFDAALPRAAALVHHGGIGTTAQAFAAGIAQVVRPMAHDQPDNAARVQRLGVGVTIPPKQFTADRVHFSLQSLLSSPNVTAACQLYAGKASSSDALTVVCQEIEALADRHAA